MTKGNLLAIALLVVVALIWGECRARQGAAEQKLRDAGRVTDSVAVETDIRLGRLIAETSFQASQIRKQAQTIAQFRARQPVIRVATDSTPRDSLLLAVAQRDTIIDSQKAIIAAQDSTITIYQAMVAARDSLIPRLVAVRNAYRVQRDAWRRQAQPGLLARVGKGLPWVAAGVIGGFALSR